MDVLLMIAEEEYADDIKQLLQEKNFYATEVGSTGEFLQYGEVILLLGVPHAQRNEVLRIIETYGKEQHFSNDGETHVRVFSMPVSRFLQKNK